jgi:Rrf2 family protein
MLTKKCQYGLKALIFLAGLPLGQSAIVEEIAKTQNMPQRFLSQILSQLQIAGFVTLKRGRGGGYSLARKSSDITASDIIRAIDGPVTVLPCESKTHYHECDDCIDKARCLLRLSFLRAQKTVSDVFDNLTLEKMRTMADLGDEQPVCQS